MNHTHSVCKWRMSHHSHINACESTKFAYDWLDPVTLSQSLAKRQRANLTSNRLYYVHTHTTEHSCNRYGTVFLVETNKTLFKVSVVINHQDGCDVNIAS